MGGEEGEVKVEGGGVEEVLEEGEEEIEEGEEEDMEEIVEEVVGEAEEDMHEGLAAIDGWWKSTSRPPPACAGCGRG